MIEAQDASPTDRLRTTNDLILKILQIERSVSLNQNFDKCLWILPEHEGGYVNDSHDPGGGLLRHWTRYIGVVLWSIGVVINLMLISEHDGNFQTIRLVFV